MRDLKHFHLMSGSTLVMTPEKSEFFSDNEVVKKKFEELKSQYINSHDTPDHKLFFSIDESSDPLYVKVVQFGHMEGVQGDVARMEKNDWLPTFMIMLAECHEDECVNSIN